MNRTLKKMYLKKMVLKFYYGNLLYEIDISIIKKIGFLEPLKSVVLPAVFSVFFNF
jgi:hypothetical protein